MALAGAGWDPVSDSAAGRQVGGPAMEAGGKTSPSQLTLGAWSQTGLWAWVQELFWGLGESPSLKEGPLPLTLSPSLPVAASGGRKGGLRKRVGPGPGRQGRGGGGAGGHEQGWFSDALGPRGVQGLPFGGPQAQHSFPKPPLPRLAPPEAPPMSRPFCSGGSDPEWLSSGSPGGGAPFSRRWQQPGRPLRLMQ